ncbi:MAG: hypothetical protein DMF95_03870 [Acidobacteria bacterium]|nr:MAG: hypothetical protein DMF96_08875 [Acidobacteriota bacterium]PYR53462.1 MAG: hypothetical protein DMF95_03870 [Acidobacteriota bacterium]
MAFITRKHLSRRTFLHGVGVTMALPYLESMLPAVTPLAQTTAKGRTRLACIYVPHGATMDKWTPATDGPGFELSEILQPLKPFYSQVNIISDLGHPQAYGGGSATANHNRSAATFLSGAHAEAGPQARLGVTVDQFAARQIGQDTPLPSIEMMIEDSSLSCGDLSCAYRDTISWQGPTSPLPMQNNPQVVFERLFGDGSTDAERRARRRQSLSLLDSVLGEASSLQRKLPAGDRSRVDQYLNDVREIERRIEKASQQASSDLTLPDAPAGAPKNVEDHIKLMFDLQVLAWQADITRVTTLLLAKELSNAVYPKSGVRDAFHILSHHSNVRENQDRFAVLNRYHVGLFAYLLGRLQATQDGDGTLLDHSMVLYGSAMGDGNQHNHYPLPIVLAGGASGRLKGGRHIRNAPETTMSNLLVAMLDKLGIPTEKFGDSTGMLSI